MRVYAYLAVRPTIVTFSSGLIDRDISFKTIGSSGEFVLLVSNLLASIVLNSRHLIEWSEPKREALTCMMQKH